MSGVTVYTPDLHAQLVKLVESGMTYKAACGQVGLHPATLYEWLKKARLYDASQYQTLLADLERAKLKAQAKVEKVYHQLATEPQQTKKVTTERIKETRFDPDGKPYSYRKQVKRVEIIEHPIEWRAPLSYLERQATDDWAIADAKPTEDVPTVTITNPAQTFAALAPKASAQPTQDAEVIDDGRAED